MAVPQCTATMTARRVIYGHTLRCTLGKRTLRGARYVHHDVPVTPVPDPQLGGYPQLPNESNQWRPALGWWDMQYRRNFGETASTVVGRIHLCLRQRTVSSSTNKTKLLICSVRMFPRFLQLWHFANLATPSWASLCFSPSSTMSSQIPRCYGGYTRMMVW